MPTSQSEGRTGRPPRVQNVTSSTQAVSPPNKPIILPEKTTSGTLTPTTIFERYNTAVFMVFTSNGNRRGQGSGFFISPDGLAVSNYHVFKGSSIGQETIKLVNNNTYKVKEVLHYSDDLDYILFKVDIGNNKVNYIPIANKLPKIGEKVYAIGSPQGLENTFSSGEISQIRDKHLIQISVPIDHGSSGGALINDRGKVIGITTSGITESGANLNFAMSIKVINREKANASINIPSNKSDLRPLAHGELINHSYFSLSYIEEHEQAEWVYYQLNKDIASRKYGRTDNFRPDPKVTTESAALSDYKYSGYDRGHLCPAASMSGNATAMSESFYLSNMSPQTASLNRGQWRMLEECVRDWIRSDNTLHVVTGPIFKDNIETIGTNEVTVPGYFYKIVYDPDESKMIGFALPNSERVQGKYYNYICSVDSIESLTGIDFFYNLDNQLEDMLESSVNASEWVFKV